MKFIPILFSTPMVQAILEGRKTQTRREVKPQPSADTFAFSFGKVLDGSERRVLCMHKQNPVKDKLPIVDSMQLPYGEPGDVLWVRETWAVAGARTRYKADHDWTDEEIELGETAQWKPSIHMPKSACRIFLEVVSVRVERLQDISEADAKQEGISIVDQNPVNIYNNYVFNVKNAMWPGYGSITKTYGFTNPKDSFHSLWESINGHQSWVINPWVWVVEFKQIEKPENFK